MSAAYPHALAHIGISVPDLDAAVAWYGEVLGMHPILPVGDIRVEDGGSFDPRFGPVIADVFGERCRHLRVAHLATGNGTAVELFEFVDPPYSPPEDNFAYTRGGVFHFAVVAPDVAATAELIERSGGRIRSRVMQVFEAMPYYACYCEDPFGTILELTSHHHAQIFANHQPLPEGPPGAAR